MLLHTQSVVSKPTLCINTDTTPSCANWGLSTHPFDQGLLCEVALCGSPAVLWHGDVLNVQLLAGVLKDIIAAFAEAPQELIPPVYGHQQLATVSLVLKKG